MQLFSVFQPIVDLNNNITVGYEALLRGPHEPSHIFKKARFEGDELLLDKLARNIAFKSYSNQEVLFVNSLPKSFVNGLDINLSAYPHLRPERIVLEIVEGKISDISKVQETIKRLRGEGFLIAIDDFGMEYSCLSLIERLVPDIIKLDRSLVQSTNLMSKNLLSGIKKLCDEVNVTVIAEGIETDEHKNKVLDSGIIFGQGWLCGRPMPLPEQQTQQSNDISLGLIRKQSVVPAGSSTQRVFR
ncbi:EAL domain-containing protein [Paenibacillus sp. LjRoot153]|uniref:EAL domain-containing protein n=1 Tax=Paenibacillus sp. LjRoot153 TaxID=3342270 RepID=UPI003ED0C13F